MQEEPKSTFVPAAGDTVALLKHALQEGHTVIISPQHAGRPATTLYSADPPLVVTCCLLFGLTPVESRMFAELMEHQYVSREALHAATYYDGRPVSKIKSVEVIVYKMRRKLAPHGITIATIWGLGYRLAEGARDRVHKRVAEYNAGIRPGSKSPEGDRIPDASP